MYTCQECRCARSVDVPGVMCMVCARCVGVPEVYVCRECRCAGSVGVPRVMCMVC